MANLKTEITNLHYNRKNAIPSVFVPFLQFASIFYDAITTVRNFCYDKKILPVIKVNAKVISVGNITTGGVGKTPVVAFLADYYAQKSGSGVCIISRGYGGKLDNKKVNEIKVAGDIKSDACYAGDEPYWLAKNTNDSVVVLTCADRVKAARYAIDKFGIKTIILDDAFQHRRIHRDINILLVDSEMKFGNENTLPYGPLRENLLGIKRADKIYIVSKNIDHKKAEQYARIMAKKLGKIVDVCHIEPDKIYNIKNNQPLDKTQEVTVLSAIGQPEQFLKFLSDLKVKDIVVYDDHHSYVREDISRIRGNIVTTEKDAVKLQAFGSNNIFALKLKTELNFDE